ncbi:MAG: DUF2029 domain-containing protein [Chitinophagaceae bacterium]|nr:MAG: DUF2029 domain-containing protein [Chitinophagaceae bacterium]
MRFLYREVRLGKFRVAVATLLWFGLALIATLAQLGRHSYKNYLIFKGVFWHMRAGTNLFAEYPAEYTDTNHYGPSFAPLIAPFAVLPDWLGVFLWCMANAAVLFWAIKKLPLPEKSKLFIVAFGAIEMMTATHNVQFNTMLAGFLVLAFVGVEREREELGTAPIAAGFLIKLYGIGAALFFVFSKHKLKFIGWFLIWCAVLFALPMLFSSPQFVLQSYADWYHSLMAKNAQNVDFIASEGYQDISVMGMIRRTVYHLTGNRGEIVGNMWVLAPAALCVLLPLLRFNQYKYRNFRLSYLAIVLISVVIFSSSAESSTYVIPIVGVGIWYALNRKDGGKWALALLIATLLLTELSPTDLFPEFIRKDVIRAFSLKCLPVFIVWCWLIANVARKDFSRTQNLQAV